jgi:hypothetical protein
VKILQTRIYHHPVYTPASLEAQKRLAEINGQNFTYYTGAYWGWGLHVGGAKSAQEVVVLLWAGLALTLNHSLAWLQSRLVLAAVLGGISSPLSYLAAARLGAVTIVSESCVWFVGLGLSWALALPILLWLASHLKQLKQEGQIDV